LHILNITLFKTIIISLMDKIPQMDMIPQLITGKACNFLLTTKAFVFLVVQTLRRVVTRYFTHIALAASSIRFSAKASIWARHMYTHISKTSFFFPYAPVHILPEGDPEAQGLRAGWGAIFEWLRTQELTTQIGIIAGMVAVGYLTYRFFFSSDGGAPGGGGPGGDDDEGGANEPDHQNIQPVNIALNNPPAGGLGHEAARYAAAAAVVGGLGHMQDRAMNPDRANAQANPNPNPNPNQQQQQQHQPQASVEVVVEAVGQAVAEQPPVAQQPILHEMNPIIPQPDQPMNPQGDAEEEGQAEQPPVDEQHPQAEEQQAILHGAIINPIIAQPRVDEQHPEAAEQANIAAEAEVEVEDEGEEAILHEPIPQGEAIINPQGAIINAEQEGQAVAEQIPVLEPTAQQTVAEPSIVVQAEGQPQVSNELFLTQEEVQRNRAAFREITRRFQLGFNFEGDFVRHVLTVFLNTSNRLQHNINLAMRPIYIRELYMISEWIMLEIHFSSLGDDLFTNPLIAASLQNFDLMLTKMSIKLLKEESDRMLSYVTKLLSIKGISSLLKNIEEGNSVLKIFVPKRLLFKSFSEIFPRIGELDKETPKIRRSSSKSHIKR
jgi:hypothetical protein